MMNWMMLGPELHCLFMGGVFLGLSMTRPNPARDYLTAMVFATLVVGFGLAGMKLEGDLFAAAYRVDLYSQVFKILIGLGMFLVVSISSGMKGIDEHYHPEYYLLLATCTLAMMMMASAVHLVALFVALELSSYSLYVLVSMRKGRGIGIDGGLKYFFVGASASAVMLMGLALIYGATRALHIGELMEVLPSALDQAEVIVGLVLTLGGFFFKLAVFPFHIWAPDAYETAADQVAAYIATASKVAAVAILMRMAALTGGDSKYVIDVLAALAVVSMTVGNLAAIVQKDLKRLLAFSSIAHAGYILIGILSMSQSGYAGTIFYVLGVVLMKFTCFLVVVKVASGGRNIAVSHLAGLHRRSPLLALALMLALFGLAGIPPTIGFTGKLLIFTAAVEQSHLSLVIIAMINVVISLYYYLLVLKAAYLLEPAEELPPLNVSPALKLLAMALITVMIVAGFYPHPLIELTRAAALALM